MTYKENYYESLRRELVEIVETKMSPVASKYGYSQEGLEQKIKWRPVVLVLGNYSSGKSTLINELLGTTIQKTGQAPTDDSFTVITHSDNDGVEIQDGMVLLNDSEYPFESLRKQGKRFASHFKLKRVRSDFLKDLAIIDTPGMLDSVSERDRGYDYQEVIGEFANIADLILVLFDPHKAGTIRETYESLRKTIPKATYEDRVLFVLNRIDECENLNDMLRVYGTLCWNLSQMTGRKDIPHIHFTYSSENSKVPEFLSHLKNQRMELRESILQAPKHRLDHLATFIEEHGERMTQYLEALIHYARGKRMLIFKMTTLGLALAGILGALSYWLMSGSSFASELPAIAPPFIATGMAAVFTLLWVLLVETFFLRRYFRSAIANPTSLTSLSDQRRKDNWEKVEEKVRIYLEDCGGRIPLLAVQKEYRMIKKLTTKASKDVREALAEFRTLKDPSH